MPLLGLADTAVIGNTGSVEELGAIALGALIFSFVYWSFGFLRMGTTGFTAQASGAGDTAEVRATLGRALVLAGGIGVALLVLQGPIAWIALELLGATPQVERLTRGYYDLRIWGAPAALGIFALLGTFVGLGRTRYLLVTQVLLNGLNIGLDILFAGVLGWGVEGIAMGTALAEWTTLFAGGLPFTCPSLTEPRRWGPTATSWSGPSSSSSASPGSPTRGRYSATKRWPPTTSSSSSSASARTSSTDTPTPPRSTWVARWADDADACSTTR